jgi:putative hydrolase of the HAD superfamily
LELNLNQPRSERPKAVFFDLDETLVENRIPIQELFGRMYVDFQDRLGAENRETFFATLRTHAGELWGSMFNSQETPEQLFTNCFVQSINSTGALDNSQGEQLAREMFDHYAYLSSNNVVFHDGALETLAKLSEAGFITGLITNGIEKIQLGKIHQLELQHKVDHVTVSAQARAHKPHAPVFELALTRAGVKANEAWQIGDHATNDVAGAIRAGMSGVFYNPNQHELAEVFSDLHESPSHVIQHLSEVLDLANN